MSNAQLATKIKALCKKKGCAVSAMLSDCGIRKGLIYDLEKRNSTPSVDVLSRIAAYLDVSVDSLMGDADIEKAFNPIPVGIQGRRPIIGSLSAGLGTFAEEEILGWETVDEQYNNDECFYFRVDGDSMSPLINDGDLLLIKRQDSVDSGDIGAFLVDGEEGFVKRVKYDTNYITLISLNPAYEPIVFMGEDVLRVRVVGKLVEMKRKF